MAAAARGPPGPQPQGGTSWSCPPLHLLEHPCAPPVLHCWSHPRVRFIPHPLQGTTEPKRGPGDSSKLSLKPRSGLYLLSHQSCSSRSRSSPQNCTGAACAAHPHLFDLALQPDDASTLGFGGPDSAHLADGDGGGDRRVHRSHWGRGEGQSGSHSSRSLPLHPSQHHSAELLPFGLDQTHRSSPPQTPCQRGCGRGGSSCRTG